MSDVEATAELKHKASYCIKQRADGLRFETRFRSIGGVWNVIGVTDTLSQAEAVMRRYINPEIYYYDASGNRLGEGAS